jgi:hypothetical protein
VSLGEEEGSYAYFGVGGKEVGIITLMQTPTLYPFWILKKWKLKKKIEVGNPSFFTSLTR